MTLEFCQSEMVILHRRNCSHHMTLKSVQFPANKHMQNSLMGVTKKYVNRVRSTSEVGSTLEKSYSNKASLGMHPVNKTVCNLRSERVICHEYSYCQAMTKGSGKKLYQKAKIWPPHHQHIIYSLTPRAHAFLL